MNAVQTNYETTTSTEIRGNGKYSELQDFELVRLCQSRDHAAFDALMRRHQRNVYAMLYRLAPDWNDTADLAQETFIRIWRGIDKLQNPKAFKSWVSQIVTNLFYDELRKRPRNTTIMSLDAPINADDESNVTRDLADPAAGPDELLDRKYTISSVNAAIAALPKQFQTALALREMEDLPYEEIARITDSDIGTVKSRICRARSKVQRILGADFRKNQAA